MGGGQGGRGITPGLKRVAWTVTVVSLALPLACASGLFLLSLPIAATTQCLLVAAVPFLRPVLSGANHLRKVFTRRRHGHRRR